MMLVMMDKLPPMIMTRGILPTVGEWSTFWHKTYIKILAVDYSEVLKGLLVACLMMSIDG